MLQYDEGKNILIAYRNKAAIPPSPERGLSKEYLSVDRYIHGVDGKIPLIKEDINTEFMSRLLQVLKVDPSTNDLHIKDIRIIQGDAGYFENYNWLVQVKFGSSRFYESKENPIGYLTVMQLPYVEEDGVLNYKGKKYAFIKMLEQEPTISYENKNAEEKLLKIKSSRSSIVVTYSKRGAGIQFSDDKNKSSFKTYSLLQSMFTMAFKHGWDEKKIDWLWEHFSNSHVTNIPKSVVELSDMKHCVIPNVGTIDGMDYFNKVVPKLDGSIIQSTGAVYDAYASNEVRNDVNNMLSLDRAINDILAEPVYSVIHPEKMLYSQGTTITQSVVDRCKAEGVYNLKVVNKNSFEGFYLADLYIIGCIPIGTRLNDFLRELTGETGMYASKTYNLRERSFGYDDSMRLTKEMVALMKANGYREIRVSEKPNQRGKKDQSAVRVFSFVNEVLSNRMFRSIDVGVQSPTGWVYLDENNRFVQPTEFWTVWDLAALLSFSTRLFNGDYINCVTNADVGFRKRLALPEQVYHRAFKQACIDGFQQMGTRLKNTWNNYPGNFGKPDEMDNLFYPFEKAFWNYLTKKMKCLIMLTGEVLTNPLAYASGMTKVNVWVSSKHSVMASQRRIAIGHYGRMDPYEIPQSAKMGVVLNEAIGCVTDLDGVTRVGYRRLKHNGNTTEITDVVDYLTVEEEEKYNIADICSLNADDNGIVKDNETLVLCKVPSISSIKKHTFTYLPINRIDYVNVHANQSIGWTSAAIPCLGSNDAARAIFGCAQEKQAKGLVNPEWPRVMTSADIHVPLLNDFFCIIAREDGECIEVGEKKDFGEGRYISVHYDSQATDDGVTYEFKDYDSAENSVTVRKVLIEEGQRFKKGDMLVSSNFVKDGVMTLGVNALVAYIPDGHNYEDGVHISDALCEKLSTYKLVTDEIRNPCQGATKYTVTHATYGRWLRAGKENALTVDMSYGHGGADKPYRFSLRKGKGFLENYRLVTRRKSRKSRLRMCEGFEVDTIAIRPHQGGDKLTNRHGNKTVMAEPERNSKMMRLMNGTPLELVYNNHGVPSRMNTGQLNEDLLGLAMTLLDSHILSDPFNGVTAEEVEMLMEYVYELANSTGDPMAVCNKFPEIPTNFHKRAVSRIRDIRQWAGCFDKKGEATLIDPMKGGEPTESKALIGYVYVEKLVQESDSKIHARGGVMAGEEYTTIADAPPKGASNGGGQRFGTMEFDALCADGASNLINELINCRGDNSVERTNMNLQAFLPSDVASSLEITDQGQRRSVTQFLYTMLALGVVVECDDCEFVPLSRDNADTGCWTPEFIARYIDGEEYDKNNRNRFDKNEEGESSQGGDESQSLEEAMNILSGLGSM